MERLKTLRKQLGKVRKYEKQSLASALYIKDGSLDLELIHHLQSNQCIGCERITSDKIVPSFAIEFQGDYSTLNKDLNKHAAGLKFSTPECLKKRVACKATFVLHGIDGCPERTKHPDIHQKHCYTKPVNVLKLSMKPEKLTELCFLNQKIFPDQKNKIPSRSDKTYFIVYPESGAVCNKIFTKNKHPENEQKRRLRELFAPYFNVSKIPLKAKLTTHLLLGEFKGKKQYQRVGNERCSVCQQSGPRKSTSLEVIYDKDVREVSGEDGLRQLTEREGQKYTMDINGKKKGAVLITTTEQRDGRHPVQSKMLRTFGSSSGPLKFSQRELKPDDRLSKNEEAARLHCKGFIEYSEKENSKQAFHFRIVEQPKDSLHHDLFARALQQASESSSWEGNGGKVCFNSVGVATKSFMQWFGQSTKQGLWELCNTLRCSGERRSRAQFSKRKVTWDCVGKREMVAYRKFIQHHGTDFSCKLWERWDYSYGEELPYSKKSGGEETRSCETVVLETDKKIWSVCELNFVLDHNTVVGNISDRNRKIHKIAHILGRQVRAVERKFLEIKDILTQTPGNVSECLKRLVNARRDQGWAQTYEDSPLLLSDSGNKRQKTTSSSASRHALAGPHTPEGYTQMPVPGDGHCLYHSVLGALKHMNIQLPEVDTYQKLRAELLKTCRTDWHENPKYSTMREGLSARGENGKTLFDDMVRRLESDDYGHGSEIDLMSLKYGLTIRIYDGTTNKWIGEVDPSGDKVISLLYVNNIHYDWLKPNVDADVIDNIGCVHERDAINVALFEQQVAELEQYDCELQHDKQRRLGGWND